MIFYGIYGNNSPPQSFNAGQNEVCYIIFINVELIVNYHPLTKNKSIYHARISEQMNGEGLPSYFICLRSERDKSVYFWSRGSYLIYNETHC